MITTLPDVPNPIAALGQLTTQDWFNGVVLILLAYNLYCYCIGKYRQANDMKLKDTLIQRAKKAIQPKWQKALETNPLYRAVNYRLEHMDKHMQEYPLGDMRPMTYLENFVNGSNPIPINVTFSKSEDKFQSDSEQQLRETQKELVAELDERELQEQQELEAKQKLEETQYKKHQAAIQALEKHLGIKIPESLLPQKPRLIPHDVPMPSGTLIKTQKHVDTQSLEAKIWDEATEKYLSRAAYDEIGGYIDLHEYMVKQSKFREPVGSLAPITV